MVKGPQEAFVASRIVFDEFEGVEAVVGYVAPPSS